MTKHSSSTPRLGVGSIDAHALHVAATKGEDLTEAVEKARTIKEPPADKSPAKSKAEDAKSAAESAVKTGD